LASTIFLPAALLGVAAAFVITRHSRHFILLRWEALFAAAFIAAALAFVRGVKLVAAVYADRLELCLYAAGRRLWRRICRWPEIRRVDPVSRWKPASGSSLPSDALEKLSTNRKGFYVLSAGCNRTLIMFSGTGVRLETRSDNVFVGSAQPEVMSERINDAMKNWRRSAGDSSGRL